MPAPVSRWRRVLARIARRATVEPTSDRDLGFVRPGELDRIVVVSPHSDDAVLSAGDLIAVASTATVVTVFAGTPAAYPEPLGVWDRACGFRPGDDVAAVRRAEDERALARLGADVVHLPHLQHSHRRDAGDVPGPPDDLDRALSGLVGGATAVVVPLGVGHPEHRVVADAALRVRSGAPDASWIAYADVPYAAIPGRLAHRLGELAASGIELAPLVPPVDPMARARKVAALEAYVSQVGALDAQWGIRRRVRETPESLWRITS